jgi:hypothetical protein
MKRFMSGLALAGLALAACGCATFDNKPVAACYWMTPDGARWEARTDVATKQQCFDLDSCSGGGGMSRGGCYKWAISPTAPAQKW